MRQSFCRLFVLCGVLLLGACSTGQKSVEYRPVSFKSLPGWEQDQHKEALVALEKSCNRILKSSSKQHEETGVSISDWSGACEALKSQTNAKDFLETWFQPHEIAMGWKKKGLFTGYYEPQLQGSLKRQGKYQTPLYLKPAELIMVDLGKFRDHLKGERIAGKVINGRLIPFADREGIEKGALKDRNLELVWTDNAVDAFFLQIQGSGRIRLDTGEILRVGYAGQNGHPYYAVGRELIKREYLTKEEVSLQSIQKWFEQNPEEAQEIMRMNASYVFFQKIDGEGPLGAEGVALTAKRSLAIDPRYVPYGVPVWIDTQNPILEKGKRLQRLLIAQDTGGAIRGAVRGDVFWGFGKEAANKAGKMKSEGRAWVLLPKPDGLAKN